MIVIDSREPSEVFEAFEEKGVPYIKAALNFYSCKECKKVDFVKFEVCPECGSKDIMVEDAGDFTNTTRSFLVERKTEGDFIGSMLDKSLQQQAARMAKYFGGWKFVFLEGFITVMVDNPYNQKIRPWIKSMRVYLRQFDICMWQMDDIYMLIDELVRLDKNAGEDPKVYDKVDDKYSGWSDSKKIVCKLVDVSDKKADVLLEEFKTPWDIFNAIMSSKILYTRTGNPKGVSGPLAKVKGFGHKFVTKNQDMLLNKDGNK